MTAVTHEDQERADPRAAWARHERKWRVARYVYPVLSRRSGGLSVGINLNPDRGCTFSCVYCQVDRTGQPPPGAVDLSRVREELDEILQAARDGSLYGAPPFDGLPEAGRVVRDIAFSGDGEPTTFPRFAEAVGIAADARSRFDLDRAKLVLITNATCLREPAVREALAVLDANNGEIWAKLDAGTEDYFRLVNRAAVPLGTVLDNILDAARARPVAVQTLWFTMHGRRPPPAEIQAYGDRLRELVAAGARLRVVQLCTIARIPAEAFVSPLADAELDEIARSVGARIDVPVEVYYGVGVPGAVGPDERGAQGAATPA